MFSRRSWMAFTTAGSRAHSVVGRCSLASAARVVPHAPAPMTVSFIVASPRRVHGQVVLLHGAIGGRSGVIEFS